MCRTTWKLAVLIVLVAAVSLTALGDQRAQAGHLSCGDVLTAGTHTLDADLTCAGVGLKVGADGVTIDLNGYKLSGDGSNFGIDDTSTTPGGGFNDRTVKDGTIEGFSNGARLYKPGGTIDNVEFNNVSFIDNGSRGIELHNSTTYTNLDVIDSEFDGNGVGIRMASNADADGINITGTTFNDHSLGFYQANDGSTGDLQDLHIDDSTFTNHTHTAV
ncbi:MAG: hypothetical protein ACE5Q6_18700, partial [Dehalococcoidia bacterium]